MVGPIHCLVRIGELVLNRRLNLFAKMVYELRHGLKSDPTERTAGHRVLATAVRYGLRVIVEAMLVKFRSYDGVNPGSLGVVHLFPACRKHLGFVQRVRDLSAHAQVTMFCPATGASIFATIRQGFSSVQPQYPHVPGLGSKRARWEGFFKVE
jgi:hypothetical protein